MVMGGRWRAVVGAAALAVLTGCAPTISAGAGSVGGLNVQGALAADERNRISAQSALDDAAQVLRSKASGSFDMRTEQTFSGSVVSHHYLGSYDRAWGGWSARYTMNGLDVNRRLGGPFEAEIRNWRKLSFMTVAGWPRHLDGRWLAWEMQYPDGYDPKVPPVVSAFGAAQGVRVRGHAGGSVVTATLPAGYALVLLRMAQGLEAAGMDPWTMKGTATVRVDLDRQGAPLGLQLSGRDLHFENEPPSSIRTMLDAMTFAGHVSDLGAPVRVRIPDPERWIDPAETDVDDAARQAI